MRHLHKCYYGLKRRVILDKLIEELWGDEDEEMSDEEYLIYLKEEDEYWEEFFMLEKIEHPEYER